MIRRGLADKVFDFTSQKGLFSAPCHVLLGLSGGADSMALLHVLSRWPVPGLRVSAVHIHHGLRGDEADKDETFVRDYCAKVNVPLVVIHADVSAVAQNQGLSMEEAGRRVRYEQFESVRCDIGAEYIVTAHTASDQSETVLMHLIRGCGVDGLAGIPSARGVIRRPLLCCDRQEIEEYCAEKQIPFVTDQTNFDMQYSRNFVRHQVLPLLREMNPSVDRALARLSKCADEESSFLNEMASDALKRAVCDGGYCVEAFFAQSSVIRRRMIRLLLHMYEIATIEEAHILAVEKVILTGDGSVDLVGPFVLSARQGIVSLREKDAYAVTPPVRIEELPCMVSFSGKTYAFDILSDEAVKVHNLLLNNSVDCDKIQGKLCLRCRQSGDYLHAAGRGVGKSLKKWMNEWHIPAHLRDIHPVLCDDAGVILIPGYTCDERVRATEDTKHFLVCKTDAE